jgi:hypothetical protein
MLLIVGANAYAQQAYKNDGPKPFCLTSVGAQGWGPGKDWSAKLCVSGKETMVVDPGPMPGMTLRATSGACYFQADAGSFFDLAKPLGADVFLDGQKCYCSFHVARVEWNHDGTLTGIIGLRPSLYVDQKPPIAITSDVKNPKGAYGNLYVTLEGHGNTEYWFKIKFGKIVAIGKAGEKGEKE